SARGARALGAVPSRVCAQVRRITTDGGSSSSSSHPRTAARNAEPLTAKPDRQMMAPAPTSAPLMMTCLEFNENAGGCLFGMVPPYLALMVREAAAARRHPERVRCVPGWHASLTIWRRTMGSSSPLTAETLAGEGLHLEALSGN